MINDRLETVTQKFIEHKSTLRTSLNENGYPTNALKFKDLLSQTDEHMKARTLRIKELEIIEAEHKKMIEIGTVQYIKLISNL